MEMGGQMEMEKETPSEISFEGLCPFIKTPPCKDCYCVKLDSISTEAILYYCGRNFQECEIYRSFSLKREG